MLIAKRLAGIFMMGLSHPKYFKFCLPRICSSQSLGGNCLFLFDGQDVEEACDFEDFFDVVTYVSDDHFTLFVHFFLGCEEDS